jgi:hypothetical protein
MSKDGIGFLFDSKTAARVKCLIVSYLLFDLKTSPAARNAVGVTSL